MYSSRSEDPKFERLALESEYIHYHGHLDCRDLLFEITQYDYGWAGFNATKNPVHLRTVLPNKLMEYLSCGLPVISFDHEAQRKFIEEHGVGIILNDIKELSERLSNKTEIAQIRQRVLENRYSFTVEKNIGKVLQLYHSLLN